MAYPSIYQIIENTHSEFAYSHYGGNVATSTLRYLKAKELSKQLSCSVANVLINLTYNGDYKPEEQNCNKIFNKLKKKPNNDYLADTHVLIDIDNNIYHFKNKKVNIKLPLSEVMKLALEQKNVWDEKYIEWDIYSFANYLERKILNDIYK